MNETSSLTGEIADTLLEFNLGGFNDQVQKVQHDAA